MSDLSAEHDPHVGEESAQADTDLPGDDELLDDDLEYVVGGLNRPWVEPPATWREDSPAP